jgi:hypothetical protein
VQGSFLKRLNPSFTIYMYINLSTCSRFRDSTTENNPDHCSSF